MQQYFFYLFHVLQLWSLLLSTLTNQPLSEEHDATKLFTNAVAQIWKVIFCFSLLPKYFCFKLQLKISFSFFYKECKDWLKINILLNTEILFYYVQRWQYTFGKYFKHCVDNIKFCRPKSHTQQLYLFIARNISRLWYVVSKYS